MGCGGICLRHLFFVVTLLACPVGFLFGQSAQPIQSAQTAQENTQAAPAAQKPAGGDLVLKSTVNRVILDVVVTDSNSRPVRGLTAKDFSVAEDGHPQEILAVVSPERVAPLCRFVKSLRPGWLRLGDEALALSPVARPALPGDQRERVGLQTLFLERRRRG